MKKDILKKSVLSVFGGFKDKDTQDGFFLGHPIEKVKCAIDVMDILVETEVELHGMKNPEDICQYVMKQLCSFYRADYVGIIEGDLDMDSWFFKWWYRKGEDNVIQKDKFNYALPDEFAHTAPSWIKAYEQNKIITIKDVERIKEVCPSEYELYKRLRATSVIGCPFYKHSTGFVVVKNPTRYVGQTALLRMLTYVLMMELDEYKMLQALKLQARNYSIETEKDVHINLCGGIQIKSLSGDYGYSNFAREEIELLTYMAFELHNKALPARELESRVWEGRYITEGQKVRHAVSGIRKKNLISYENHLIESVDGGYRFNPNLSIKIDVQEFLKLENLLPLMPNDESARKMLEDMVAMYKGPIILTKDSSRWMVTNHHHMQNHYLKTVNRLLNIYFKMGDYESLHRIAAHSMHVFPHNVEGYYWKLRAYRKLGLTEYAQSLLEDANACLKEDIYQRLVNRLERMDDENVGEIYEPDY